MESTADKRDEESTTGAAFSADVIIVDYGVGNLFSVQNACRTVGLTAEISSCPAEVEAADALIVPGMGAFANAMDSLDRLDLINPIVDHAQSGKILIGICLGLQLFMSESEEFGSTKGLGLIDGPVKRFSEELTHKEGLKVPHVGWNRVSRTDGSGRGFDGWAMNNIKDGEQMYFVHSYHACPTRVENIKSLTNYGSAEFCSSVEKNNIYACQFHPERSGKEGLKIYQNIADRIFDRSMNRKSESQKVRKSES